MTGSVPYYGGRLRPAQAYAASHPGQPVPEAVWRKPTKRERESQKSLQQLLDDQIITPDEYQALRSRVRP